MIGQRGALGVVRRLVLLGVLGWLIAFQTIDFSFRLGFGLRGGELNAKVGRHGHVTGVERAVRVAEDKRGVTGILQRR